MVGLVEVCQLRSHSTNTPPVHALHALFGGVTSRWGFVQSALNSLNTWPVGSCLTSCDPVAFRMTLTHL